MQSVLKGTQTHEPQVEEPEGPVEGGLVGAGRGPEKAREGGGCQGLQVGPGQGPEVLGWCPEVRELP